jgi:hypothetical protein
VIFIICLFFLPAVALAFNNLLTCVYYSYKNCPVSFPNPSNILAKVSTFCVKFAPKYDPFKSCFSSSPHHGAGVEGAGKEDSMGGGVVASVAVLALSPWHGVVWGAADTEWGLNYPGTYHPMLNMS